MKSIVSACMLAAIILASAACTTHSVRVEPIEVRPIHMTVDINIKVDRELDQFFRFEEEILQEMPSTSDGEQQGARG
jgi:hypothetical protein